MSAIHAGAARTLSADARAVHQRWARSPEAGDSEAGHGGRVLAVRDSAEAPRGI